MNNIFNGEFFFNSTGNMNNGVPFRVMLDSNGNYVDKNKLEYGIYNKYIEINYSKLFYIKKQYIGLGDIIDYITDKTKIKDLVIYLTKGNCGCEERRIKFNKWLKIPYLIFKVRPLYMNDIEFIDTLKVLKKNKTKIKNYNPYIANKQKMPTKEQILQNKDAPQINSNKMEPLKTEQIKGGCGCKNKKRSLTN